MAALTPEDAQVLRALVDRMSAVEARLNDVEGATAASERAIASTNASANALVNALRLEFDRLQAQVTSLADQLSELQTAGLGVRGCTKSPYSRENGLITIFLSGTDVAACV